MNSVWIAFAFGMIIGASVGIMIIGMLSMSREEEEFIMAKPRITEPEEDMFYKYPVLKIPVDRRSEQLIIGVEKARAIVIWFDAIREFLNKHSHKEEDSPS